MKHLFKEYVSQIVPYEPGKPIDEVERELGVRHAIKLASNENPLGPSPKALKAMRRAVTSVHLYPDGGCSVLKKRLAETLGLVDDQIIIGNGSNEIIELLARGFLREGDGVVSAETSFLVYPLIAQVSGASYTAVPLRDFRYDLEGILSRVDSRTRLVFVANPNNPTGTYVKGRDVEEFLNRISNDVIVCFDEAYVDFVEAKDFPDLLRHVRSNRPNLVVLRTFSKSYGLAGLRVGYGVGSRQVIQYLGKIRQPFNVNHVAQAGACAALEDRTFLERSKKVIREGKLYLYRALTKMGLEFVSSEANFVLVDVRRDGKKVFHALLKRGIIVRSMTAYGLPNYIRITIGTRSDLDRLIGALTAVLKEGESSE